MNLVLKGLKVETIQKSLIGSLARGILWVLAYITAKMGVVDSQDQNAVVAQTIAEFVISTGCAALSVWWARRAHTGLLMTDPPAEKPKVFKRKKKVAVPLILMALMLAVGCNAATETKTTPANADVRNRALLVAINEYPDPEARLHGCINDCDDVATYLMGHAGFKAWEIMILTDQDATAENIRRGMKWVAADYRTGDRRFMAYSGHGTQMPGAREGDGKFECICPVDFDWTVEHAIRDVDFVEAFGSLPKGAIFDWISDSCHSGGLADDTRGQTTAVIRDRAYPMPPAVAARLAAEKAEARPIKHTRLNVGFISGCRSNQTSADACFNGRPNGAFTYYWIKRLLADPNAPQERLAASLREDLKAAGFRQLPVADGQRTGRATLK